MDASGLRAPRGRSGPRDPMPEPPTPAPARPVPDPSWRGLWSSRGAWSALALVGLATAAVAGLLFQTADRLERDHVERVGQSMARKIAWRLREQELVLDSCRALFEASESVEPAEWTAFVRRLLDEDLHGGFTALGFVAASRAGELRFVEAERDHTAEELAALVRGGALEETLARGRAGGRPVITGVLAPTGEGPPARSEPTLALVAPVRAASGESDAGHVIGLLALERLVARTADAWSIEGRIELREEGAARRLAPLAGERIGEQSFEYGGRRFRVTAAIPDSTLAATYRGFAGVGCLGGGLLALLAFLAIGRLSAQRRELRRLVTELEQASVEARAASVSKDRFLTNMSHELRTPLNGVVGALELLMADGLGTAQRELATTARDSARALAKLFTNLLDYAGLEAGRCELEAQVLDLRELVESALELYAPRALGRGVELRAEIDPSVAGIFEGDRLRLGQALLHLIDNALRFTERGAVRVRVRPEREDAAGVLVRVEVHDTGPGIAPQEQGRLFRSFAQLDDSTTRRHGGAGLGLALTRALAEHLGGGVGLESEPGRGSCFWLSARLRRVAPEPVAPLPSRGCEVRPESRPERRTRLRVLLAEDDRTNQLVARRLLERAGHTVVVVSDGSQAVEAFLGGEFDAVLMDCQMPGLDGYEATRRIRASGPRGAAIPIVALTSHALQGDRERCLAVGMDEHLTKPVDPERLRGTLERLACAAVER